MSKKRSRPDTRRAHLEELERRILLSADLESALVDPSLAAGVDPNDPAVQAELLQQEEAGTHDAAVVRRELVLVDAGVEDYEALLADLQSANSQARQLEVVLLDGERDGIQQISEILEAREDLDAIHIVSHGTEGAVQLGSTWLTRENLDAYQSAMAGWGDALSEKADLLFYGCDLAGGASGAAFAEALSGLTGADVAASTDATGSAILGGDWDLEYQAGVVETSVALGGDSPASFQGTLDGTAIWHQDGQVAPIASPWDGASFGGAEKTVELDEWRIIQGAEAPTRDEKIVVGVDSGGAITGMMWDGAAWNALPLNPLGTVSEIYWWGCDVAYESQSGDAVLVWNDNSQDSGDKLRFSVWDGDAWTTPASIADYTGAEPQQIKIASNPRADGMVLVVSDSNADDYALVWTGASWGSAVPLDSSGTGENDQSGISVAYEAQTGRAMVMYGKDGDSDAYYRIWNGASWEGEESVAAPSGVTSQATWTALGSDPTTDRLVLGVLTSGGTAADVWLSVWDGSSWEGSTLAETTATGSTFPGVAVAFESQSGEALAVYGQNGQSAVRYRTWSDATGWLDEQSGPGIGGTPNSMTLDSDPSSNGIMLSVQDSNNDLNYLLWDGAAWGTPDELETETGETKNQPFLFLWDQEAVNDAPVNTVPSAQATPEDTALVFSSAGGNAISIGDVDAFSSEVEVTLGVTNGKLTLNLNAAPQAGETRVNSTTTSTQSFADIDYAADGSFVVVWQSDHASAGNYEVYGQRFDSSGAAVGGEILVNTTTAKEQSSPTVGVSDDGSFIVVWQCDSHGDDKNNSLGIVAQRFDSNGVKLGGEFLVNTTVNGDQQSASVAVDASGNFVVVWSGGGSGDADGVFFQRYDASGVAQGSEIRVNTTTTDTQDSPDLAMDSAGNFAVVWESNLQDGSGTGIYGRLFNADGTARTGELLVNTTTSGNQASPVVAMDDAGNFVAAWVGFDANLTGVFAQRFDSTGAQQGSQFQVNQTVFDMQTGPAVAMDADGNFAISWHSNMQAPDFGGTAVMAREYLAGGGARGNEFIVNSTYGGSQLSASVACADTGAMGIVWQGSGAGDADGVFLQRYQSPSLTFSVGAGTADATMTFTGTIADINQALDGVIYAPNPGYNGYDTLTITTNDLGNTGTGGPLSDVDTVDITVGNPNAPAVDLSGADQAGNDFSASWTEGSGPVAVVDADATLVDSDENLTQLTVTITNLLDGASESLSANPGATGLLVNYDSGAGVLTISGAGTAADYQQVLRTARYDNTSDTPDTTVRVIAFTPTDSLSNGNTATTTLTMTATNDPPVNAVPGAQSTTQDTPLLFSLTGGNGISVDDSDAATGELQVTLTVNNGTLRLSPAGPLGAEALVNSTTADSQSYADLVVAPDGSYAVVWQSYNQDGGDMGVYVQRFAADGTALGAETLVNTTTANWQQNPAIAMDAGGNFVVVWDSYPGQDGAWYGVYGQLFNASGNKVGGEFPVNTTTASDQRAPDVALDPGGDFVVVWAGNGVGDANGVFFQRFDAAGLKQGSETLVNTSTTGDQSQPSIAMDGSGNYVVAWYNANDQQVYARRYDVSDTPLTGEFVVNTTASGIQSQPSVDMNSAGQFVIAWCDEAGKNIYAQRYDAGGSAQGGEFQVNIDLDSESDPQVAVHGDGSFAISFTRTVGTDADVYVRRYDADGNTVGAEVRVNTTTAYIQTNDSVGMLPNGDVLVAWHGNSAADSAGILTRRFGDTVSSLVFSAGGGVDDASVTFTGTLSEINAALDGLTYMPNPGYNGGDTLTITTSDQGNSGTGGALSDVDTVDINVGSANSPSVLAGIEATPLAYTENDAATVVTSTLTVSDADDTHIGGATIQITGNYVNGEDVLAFTDTAAITGSWNATTGTLTLTGSDTLANYRDALVAVTYLNTSDNPSTLGRTVSFTVNDGDDASNSVTRDINVTSVNDDPTNAGSLPTDLVFLEDTQGKLDLSQIDLTDVDAGAGDLTLTISSANGHLQTMGWPGLVLGGSQTVLTLTGKIADLNDFLNDVNSIDYEHATPNMSGDNVDLITIEITDNGNTGIGGGGTITLGTVNIDVSAANDAPTAADSTVTTNENTTYLFGASDFNFSDIDGDALSSVRITSLETAGSLQLSGGDVTLNQVITRADIDAGNLTFTPAADANGAGYDSFQFRVNDGTVDSAASYTMTIDVTAVNDAPIVDLNGSDGAGTNYTVTFTEDGGAVAVTDADAIVSDADDTEFQYLGINLFNMPDGASEAIVVAGYTFTYGTGDVVTRTVGSTEFEIDFDATGFSIVEDAGGNIPLADLQTLMRGITYENLSQNPTPGDRAIEFEAVDASGLVGPTATSTVSVNALNDAPVVTTTGGATSYAEQATATVIDSGVTVVDPDGFDGTDPSDQFVGVVRITGNYEAADILGFTDTAKIQGVLTGDQLVLSVIAGQTATVAEFEAALQSITFYNGSDTPSGLDRTISFSFDDGVDSSNIATRVVRVTGVDDAPIVDLDADDSSGESGGDFATSWTEGLGPVAIADVDALLSDVDSPTFTSMNVRIINLLDGAFESLSSDTTGTSINANYNTATGLLTLIGFDSVANYQQVLRTVVYDNTAASPDASARVVQFTATDGITPSNTATTTVTIDTNEAPVVTPSGVFVQYNENATPVQVDPSVTVSDSDSATLAGATVRISGNYTSGEDVLSFADQLGISGSWDAGSGTLTLSGSATVGDYQTALRAVTYHNTSEAPNTAARTIEFIVSDGADSSTPATRSLSIVSWNDAPVTDDVSANGLEDAVSIPITLTGRDVDGTVDRFRLSTLPANGTLYTDAGLSTAAVTGVDYGATGESLTLHFVPDADWSGVTTFEYAAKSADGGIDSSPATATITVNSVNDDPTNAGSLPTDVTVIEDSISARGSIVDRHQRRRCCQRPADDHAHHQYRRQVVRLIGFRRHHLRQWDWRCDAHRWRFRSQHLLRCAGTHSIPAWHAAHQW